MKTELRNEEDNRFETIEGKFNTYIEDTQHEFKTALSDFLVELDNKVGANELAHFRDELVP
jgi:hypothetical protein